MSAGSASAPCAGSRGSLLRRVGVDVVVPGAAFPSAADVPAEEVEALVDRADPRLLGRQAEPERREHLCDLAPERLRIAAAAGDHHHEVVRVADEPGNSAALAAMLDAPPHGP